MNQKFGLALHILTYLDLACHDKLCTSNEIAESIRTNPVVVRRLLPELKVRGFVETKRGQGGIKLKINADQISLYDVYELCVGDVLNIKTYDDSVTCPIASHMHDSVYEALSEANELFYAALKKKTIRDISENILTKTEKGELQNEF